MGRYIPRVNVFAQGGGACAEFTVLAMAISDGKGDVTDIVAVGDRGRGVIPPCGSCRQLLLDYAPEIRVITSSAGRVGKVAIGELLPSAFRSWFLDEWADGSAIRSWAVRDRHTLGDFDDPGTQAAACTLWATRRRRESSTV